MRRFTRSTNHGSSALCVLASVLTVACGESSDPASMIRPNFAAGGVGRPTVLVNPNSSGNGTAKTIQEGIDMVASGGKVLLLPGTYHEAVRIDRGVTLEAVGSEPVVIAPLVTPSTALEIATAEPVIIRGLTVHARPFGIRGVPALTENVTVERAVVLAIDPPLGTGFLIDVVADGPTGTRGALIVRESFLDGGVTFARTLAPPLPQVFGIRAGADLDTRLEGNVIRHTGGACIQVIMRDDLGGRMNVDIVDNDLDECYAGRAGAIIVAPAIPRNPPFPPVSATGTVNLVGNTIRNSTGSCLPTTGIYYEFYTGRIEHNRIDGVVRACTVATDRARPAGIWIGSLRGLTAATPVVRFNDIVGNAQAGLRVAGNITTTLDASCNWWGSASGPSGAGAGNGDALVVQPGAATPVFLPFATVPIVGTPATGC